MARLNNQPQPGFTIPSSVAVVIGVVVGIGIFRLPPIVADHAASGLQFMLFWLAGGVISLLGALCYAELAASRPDAGGEYHFLSRAFGRPPAFLFAWARMTVIQTGSIALIAFILGDYASQLLPIGPWGAAVYATLTIIVLTVLNMLGTRHSRRAQNLFTGLIIALLILLPIAALISVPSAPVPAPAPADDTMGSLLGDGSLGMAMIFVLLTYGGWNEAAYLSAELHDVRRNMVRVLMYAIGTITLLYLLVNAAYLHVLGLEGLREADTVASLLAERIFGDIGSIIVSVIVMLAALSTANATIITGARTNYALGRDFGLLRFIGRWNGRRNTPVHALLVQGAIALLLVALGAAFEESISTIVDYTAPVFWFFIMLTTATLFVFRRQHGGDTNSYRVPLYPLVPLLFLLACAGMLYSSLTYTGLGAVIGVAILASGVPVYLWAVKQQARE
ncbi:amino acid transporter [Methylohalomonas lacus]|uniref:Amino acid transporter n=1 Tax=Methylohalomonas lacus TaxID=398773 RepID=A0AAE3L5Y2_9GAMM|nr:amino acid permease [Methylohalomonas lacus]MCS3904257.1 amino acid transporter [Methylohalomonas lacus]